MRLLILVQVSIVLCCIGCTKNSSPVSPNTIVVHDTVYLTSPQTNYSLHDSDISVSQTWGPSQNPHRVSKYITIKNSAVLTILPGTIIKFDTATGLIFNADSRLHAVGTAQDSILFTSILANPYPGSWRRLYFDSLPGLPAIIDSMSYAHVAFGGFTSGGQINTHRTISITHSTISNCGADGIFVCNPSAQLHSFAFNRIESCTQYPLRFYPACADSIDSTNVFVNNVRNRIAISGQTYLNVPLFLSRQTIPYEIQTNILIDQSFSGESWLAIAPGNTVMMGAGVEINARYGKVIAQGTATDSIKFMSSSTYPQKGDWTGFYFEPASYPGSASQFAYCQFHHASKAVYIFGGGSALDNYMPPTVSNCLFENNSYAIRVLQLLGYYQPFYQNVGNTFLNNTINFSQD